MRLGRVLTTALVMGFLSAAAASASPITDPASLNADGSAQNPYTSPLFDLAGNPFLLTSAPSYFSTYSNNNGNNDGNAGSPGNGGPGAFGSFVADSLFSDPAGSGPGGAGNVGDPNAGGDPGDNTSNPGNTNDIASIIGGNALEIASEGPGPQGNVPGSDTGSFGPSAILPPPVAPEPATLLLLGSGLVALVRRRSR